MNRRQWITTTAGATLAAAALPAQAWGPERQAAFVEEYRREHRRSVVFASTPVRNNDMWARHLRMLAETHPSPEELDEPAIRTDLLRRTPGGWVAVGSRG